MESYRATIRKATGESGRDQQYSPAVVLLAGNKSDFFIKETHGFKTLDADSAPIDLDTIFKGASCTKLMTTVAALQVVERGLVDLDEDITRVLHEWKDAKVLTGFDENGKPVTSPAKNKMTLRQLLTHSAGMGYDFITENIMKYRQAMGLPPIAPGTGQTLMEMSGYPLMYEPGEGWEYSYSIDWAGAVVERVSGCKSLEEYMSKNIWGPLGASAISFRLNEREDIRSNLTQMLTRDSEGHLVASPNVFLNPETFAYDAGGSGLFFKPTDYAKLLSSLLRNDGVVLKKETVDMMFTPQLKDTKYLKEYLAKSLQVARQGILHGLPDEVQCNFGLGGMIIMEDVPGKRRKGTLHWGGLPNLQWWIDRTSNVYAMYSTQLDQFGDQACVDLGSGFEQAVYQELAQ